MYVKIFDRILRSSIMEADVRVRWLWVVLLVMADAEGYITATESAIARTANMPLDDVRDGLRVLMSEDANSTTSDHDGRRVIAVAPNTWFVPNKAKYRDLRDETAQRHATRERVRRWRQRYACSKNSVKVTEETELEDYADDIPSVTSVTERYSALHGVTGNAVVTGCNDKKIKIKMKKKSKKEREGGDALQKELFRPPTLAEVEAYLQELGETRFTADAVIDYYAARGWRTRSGPVKDWKACVRTWRRFENQRDHEEAERAKRRYRLRAPEVTGIVASAPGRCVECGAESETTFCSRCQEEWNARYGDDAGDVGKEGEE